VVGQEVGDGRADRASADTVATPAPELPLTPDAPGKAPGSGCGRAGTKRRLTPDLFRVALMPEAFGQGVMDVVAQLAAGVSDSSR
jgi:hypothetical protein